jgi:hypothetical protein
MCSDSIAEGQGATTGCNEKQGRGGFRGGRGKEGDRDAACVPASLPSVGVATSQKHWVNGEQQQGVIHRATERQRTGGTIEFREETGACRGASLLACFLAFCWVSDTRLELYPRKKSTSAAADDASAAPVLSLVSPTYLLLVFELGVRL